MRKEFHHQLEVLRADLGTMCGLAGVAARRATAALLSTICAKRWSPRWNRCRWISSMRLAA